jgi:hypothetical protein
MCPVFDLGAARPLLRSRVAAWTERDRVWLVQQEICRVVVSLSGSLGNYLA